ncbi:hypothetical protein C8F01DRAFT_1263629 [Mycena amicta]|nr:hypothetical protein C8F01DRAFT_1263629 [Mycena amicta]
MAVLVPDYDGQSLQTPDVLANLLQYAMYEPMSLPQTTPAGFSASNPGGRQSSTGFGRTPRRLWTSVAVSFRLALGTTESSSNAVIVVRIIRGTHTGKIGFMASLRLAATVPCTRPRFMMENMMTRLRKHQRMYTDSHLVFENFDHQSDLQLRTQDSNVGERPWMALKRKHRQLMLDMKDKLDWVRHKEILIVGKQHHMKGLAGQVIDYQWTAPPKGRQCSAEQRTPHDVLSPAGGRADDVKRDNECHVHQRSPQIVAPVSPLERAHVLTSMKDGCFFERVNVPVRQIGEEDLELQLARSKYGDPPQLDELDELRWLINLKFIGKRVDLKVGSKEDFTKVMRSYGNLARKISNKHIAYADQVGFLVPLEQRPLETDRINKLFPFISPTSRAQRVNLPLPVLQPVRTIDGVSIAEFAERVIVIGPDVYGKTYRIGHYAEVVPRTMDHPMLVVRVRFKWERTDSGSFHREESLYWLQALCRSTNERIDDPAGPDMDFNAIPP